MWHEIAGEREQLYWGTFKDVVGNDNISVWMRIPQEETNCKTKQHSIQWKLNSCLAHLIMLPYVPLIFTILGPSMVKYHIKKKKTVSWTKMTTDNMGGKQCWKRVSPTKKNIVTYLLSESVNNINVCSLWLLSPTEFLTVPQISLPMS